MSRVACAPGRLAVAALGLLALGVSGCAFGNRQVNLSYPATLPATPAAPPTYGRVAVARFGDARDAKQGTGRLLGKVRNGYGIPTASVLANQDPVLWVNEGVARALAARGLTVERVSGPSGPPDVPTITGTVSRVSGGMYMSMDANISADLTIEHQGRSVGSLVCIGQARRVAWTASTEEYRSLFETAMGDFADECGSSLTRMLTGTSP
jgi:hypothetical protein